MKNSIEDLDTNISSEFLPNCHCQRILHINAVIGNEDTTDADG